MERGNGLREQVQPRLGGLGRGVLSELVRVLPARGLRSRAARRGERARSQLLLKLGGALCIRTYQIISDHCASELAENMLMLAVNVLAVKIWLYQCIQVCV